MSLRCITVPARSVALILAGVFCSPALHADNPADSAWRNFQHALGEPASIGANADHNLADTAFRPIPAVTLQDIDARKFQLGADLFHERRLSSDSSIACITCHAGPVSGTDGRPISVGVNRARGSFNSLTTFNAVFNFRQFWDGRSVTLADQAIEPIISELEMANTLDAVLDTLQADTSYLSEFQNIYPDGLSINNMADAMAHFQSTSFTVTDTPFQRHLNGEAGQLSENAIRGLQLFQQIGCVSCHNGINLGGNSYQRLGALRPFYPERREAGPNDAGLARRSHREQDLYAVKVPSLHNVVMTVPYFHDGSVPTLNAAIAEMAIFQLNRELSQADISDIAAFLRSLNGRPTGLSLGSEIERVARDMPSQQGQSTSNPSTSHIDAYRAAVAAIEPAHHALLAEMHRVDTRAVAHYDFVQFQHLELIRHARALQHPPSTLPEPVRAELTTLAEQLLADIHALEWHIADFLQAQAMIGVLMAHQHTPEARSDNPNEISAQISTHQATARQSMANIGTIKTDTYLQQLEPLL